MISQLKPVFKTLRNAEYVSNDYLYIQNQVQLITHTKKEAMVMKSKKTLYHAKRYIFFKCKKLYRFVYRYLQLYYYI